MRRGSFVRLMLTAILGIGAVIVWVMEPSAPGDEAPPVTEPGAGTSRLPLLEGAAQPAPPPSAHGSGTPGMWISGIVRVRGHGVPALVELVSAGQEELLRIERWLEAEVRLPFHKRYARRLGDGALQPIIRTRSDAQGRFAFPTVPLGIYSLWARDAHGRAGHQRIAVRTIGAHREILVELGDGENTFSGRVLRRQGEPFVGVVRIVAPGLKRGLARVHTDSQGHFAVRGLPRDTVHLLLTTEERLVAVSPAYGAATPDAVEWIVEDGTRWTVEGQVRSRADEQPVVGALVQASTDAEDGSTLMSGVHTGATGRFRLPVQGTVESLQVLAKGFHGETRTEATSGEEIAFLLDPLLAVSGRVVEKGTGRPIAEAVVYGVGMQIGCAKTVARSGADGTFVLSGLRPGEAMLFVLGGGHVSERLADVAFQSFNPFLHQISTTLTPVTLEVVPATLLEGSVVDDDGNAVGGARLQPELLSTTSSSNRPLWGFRLSPAVASAENGTFRHDGLIPGGTYRFRVEAPGFPETESSPFVVPRGKEPQRLRIRLSRRRWVPVRIKEAGTGHPLAGVLVCVDRFERYGTTQLASGRTDAQGEVRIGPLPPGRLGLRVLAVDHIRAEEPLPVPSVHVGEQAAPLEVTLKRGVVVQGRVVLPEGHDPDGLEVEARWTDSAKKWGHRRARVAAAGTFELRGLRRDRYELSALREGPESYLSGSVTVETPAIDVVLALEQFDLAEFDAEIDEWIRGLPRMAVRTTTPDGMALVHRVLIVHPQPLIRLSEIEGSDVLVAIPEDAKEICIEYPGGASWNPACGSGIYGPFPAEAQGSIEIALEPGQALRGQVLKPDGRGLAGVRVGARPTNPLKPFEPHWSDYWYSSHEQHTDAEGRFEFVGLRAGAWWLAAAVPPELVFVDPIRVQVAGDDVVIRTRRGVEVVVKVHDDAGKPYVGAKLRAARWGGPAGQPGCNARTDGKGNARLVGLDPSARYFLWVDAASDVGPDLEDVRIDDWIPAETTVRLHPPGR